MGSNRRPPAPPISGKFCDDPVLDYKDVDNLRRFLTVHGQILSRKRTGYCSQCQKALKQHVKRARHVGLLPFVG
jgi:small subunit ribosomal protein S18